MHGRMSCGCGKKKELAAAIVSGSVIDSIDVDEWGPAYWKILHCLSARLGRIGDAISDGDEARLIEYLVKHLGEVIPCASCQKHATTYNEVHPIRWIGERGAALRGTVSLWLMNFHNDVRSRKGQTIEIIDLATYEAAYLNCNIIECEIEIITRAAKYAIDHNIIRPVAWKRWMITFRKLKLAVGA